MRRFIIERDIPKVGSLEREQLREAAAKSSKTLASLGTDIQWVQSYVAADKTFCVYLANDEAIILDEGAALPEVLIHFVAGDNDDTTQIARAAAGCEHVRRARHVGRIRAERIAVRLAHQRLGGHMNHDLRIDSGHDVAHPALVADVADDGPRAMTDQVP